VSDRVANHKQIDVALPDPLIDGVVSQRPPAMAMLGRYRRMLLLAANKKLTRQNRDSKKRNQKFAFHPSFSLH
jgi:hypothetical protein